MTVHRFEKEPGALVSKGAIIRNVSAHVIVSCTCGTDEPVSVHFIPEHNLKAKCQKCGTTYFLGRFMYDSQAANNSLQVGIIMMPPTIVAPALEGV